LKRLWSDRKVIARRLQGDLKDSQSIVKYHQAISRKLKAIAKLWSDLIDLWAIARHLKATAV
jgi:hypothetical protein